MPPATGLSTSGLTPRSERLERVIALGTGAGLLTLLVVASWLAPSPAGSGTHTQLGLPRCGWVAAFNRPCPTCGMTTAFAHAAHGHAGASFVAQPMGAVLAVLSAAGFWASLHVVLTGSRVGSLCGSLLRPRVLWVVLGAGAAAWAYKFLTWPV